MIHDWKMELYWRLPVFFQETALSLYARKLDQLYYGDGYDTWCKKFEQWKTWSRSETEAWQNDQLQSIIELAATRVPYYREQWRNLDWKSVHSARDLLILSLLDKQSIRQNEKAFTAEGLRPESLWLEKTSGTTGTSLGIYWAKSKLPQFWAIMEVMVRNVAGVARDIPRSMMGGRPIVRGNTSKPPLWRYNRSWKQLYLSSYHVSKNTAQHYAEAIKRYGSEWITGYGSAIAALAEFASSTGVPETPLRAAIVSGDTLLPGMRASIEAFFDCKCFDQYGQAEGVAMAMECRAGRMHIVPWVGIVEILRDDGSPCLPGEVGEIVATGLLNDAMPLIRYRLGDYAAWAEDQNCSCGNRQPVIANLEGRVDDYLITKDGRKIGRLSTAMKRSPTIHSAQIVQDKPGHAYLLVRPGEGYRRSHAVEVCDDILEKIGNFELEITEVSAIWRTVRGKTPLVVRLAERQDMMETVNRLLLGRSCAENAA